MPKHLFVTAYVKTQDRIEDAWHKTTIKVDELVKNKTDG